MNARHLLKTHPAVWHAVKAGSKTFEVRKDDRQFQMGDIVDLSYYDPLDIDPSPAVGGVITKRVGFVLRGGQYGLEPGYVAFSLFEPNDTDFA